MDERVKAFSVLLLSPLPPPSGGIATWTRKYIGWSLQNNIDVEIVNTAIIGNRASQLNKSRSVFEEIKRTTIILRALKSYLGNGKEFVGHINTPCGKYGIIRDYLCAKLMKNFKVPFIVHYRCNIEDQLIGMTFQKIIFRKLARLATENVVLNTPSKEYIRRATGRDSKIIPNFIDKAAIRNAEKNVNTDLKRIIFAGHVQETKGVKEILLTAREFPDISFILAGPIASSIKELKVTENVRFAGELLESELKSLLEEADAFLFPTYTEGFSNALLEAMAMGLPVITTGVGANKDMIEEKGGIIVREGNISDIVEAINKLKNRELRQKISIWNLNKVKEHYQIDDIMGKLLSIYLSALK
ncbi:glycosyltransferase family 4 protein [Indiicoccus explosivorum]|uniref:glycosyltransferase family 4 protein n=1 Tax=Indiicoccus explosivorum TaxID=1917864 RepID=UPI000B430140|nr:glycosyltransferase family 4 protein [Indiicoccus explosivorum]